LSDYAGFRFRTQTSHRFRALLLLLIGRQWDLPAFVPAGTNLSKLQKSQKNIARNSPLAGSN
jgi:hypothetical protein